MTRILVKGGIWKNTEDEILKVAVMKYGKNQWSRIASLLHKKTAKQCKARWHEWLDPGIKKTEWSREEDEKLLHLAKLMPTQWRTIAPLVGRTASQCLERYEHLLDQAQMAEGGHPETEDPRKLRPGEVDPNPETKPARPDPIDMDEDELEMLSEARARLANTQGKKAKRKAREKQLDEARRLATLQKKRELKAAGVKFVNLQKLKRVCDYNLEVPFEKKPALGFYDTSKETIDATSDEFKEMRIKEYTRRDRVEILERRKDKEKFKEKQENDPVGSIMLTSSSMPTKRSKLILPQPQISQIELEEVIKLGREVETAKSNVLDGLEDLPTKSLLNDYGVTPFNNKSTDLQSLRTPVTADSVMRDAQTLLALNLVETPLKGGLNNPLGEDGLNFRGATPKPVVAQTPNTLLSSPFLTPGRQNNYPGSRIQTPFRDNLNINKDGNMSSFSSVVSTPSSHKEKNISLKQLRDQLSSLPNPIDDFEISIPNEEEDEEIESKQPDKVEDALEEIEREKQRQQEKERINFLLLPESVRRNLPIPTDLNLNTPSFVQKSTIKCDKYIQKAEEEILNELNGLLKDNNQHNKYTLDHLNKAKEVVMNTFKSTTFIGTLSPSPSTINQVWEDNYLDLIYIPSEKRFTRLSLAKHDEKIESSKKLLETLQQQISKNVKLTMKQEEKLKLLHGGYISRRDKMSEEYNDLLNKLQRAELELSAFELLSKQEIISTPHRITEMEKMVEKSKLLERSLQYRYSELKYQIDVLLSKKKQTSAANS